MKISENLDKFRIFSQEKSIEDKTRETISSKLKTAYKFFNYEENIFKDEGSNVTSMLEEARCDMMSFFSGKEIVKKIDGFSSVRYLNNLSKQDYPGELENYINKVKKFYAN